ncbi:MAG: hypothetical protein AAGG01_03850, partial [Planctomycetota bacterium]
MKSKINFRSGAAFSAGAAVLITAAAVTSVVLSSRAVGFEETGTSPEEQIELVSARDVEPAPPAGEIADLGVHGLLRAVPFVLENGYTHYYRADQPTVNRGWLLAVEVRTDLVQPTNDFQSVLYAHLPSGAQTVERFNQGHKDGVLVGFLPELSDSPDSLDALENVAIWFG